MEFSEKLYPYKKTREKLPNPRLNITVLKTNPCSKPEFLEIMCSYGDVSKKTAEIFLDAFTKEFKETIVNCKRICLKFGTFVGGYEDKTNPPRTKGFPDLKKKGIYSGVLFYMFPKPLRKGYVHKLEEERMYYEGVKRGDMRPCAESNKFCNKTYPAFIPGRDRLVSRKQFTLNLAMRAHCTFEMSERLLEALELTVIELIRSNKYFAFKKTVIIGGYPRIAANDEIWAAGLKGTPYVVKDYCPFCRTTTKYNELCKGRWIAETMDDFLAGD